MPLRANGREVVQRKDLDIAMHFYYAKTYHRSSAGKRLVSVTCERCRCAYAYELVRVGSGVATAHYGIGGARAERSATELASHDLALRLNEESELVPCPDCHWVNEELIAGYRRGRYRGWTGVAAGLAIAGSLLALVIAWFIRPAPAGGPSIGTWFLVGGPAFSIGVAVSLLVLRRWLLNRIDPNRDYPLPPTLPAGTPDPLKANDETGELEVVRAAPADEDGSNVEMIVQIGRFNFPDQCCACLDTEELASVYGVTIGHGMEIGVPLCASCARRRKIRMWRAGILTSIALTALSALVLALMQLDEVAFSILLGAVIAVSSVVGVAVASRVDCPLRVKVVDAPRGVLRIRFRSEKYAQFVERDGNRKRFGASLRH